MRGQDLDLNEENLEIIRKEKVNGRAFLKVTEEKLRSIGLALGPATTLADSKERGEERLNRAQA